MILYVFDDLNNVIKTSGSVRPNDILVLIPLYLSLCISLVTFLIKIFGLKMTVNKFAKFIGFMYSFTIAIPFMCFILFISLISVTKEYYIKSFKTPYFWFIIVIFFIVYYIMAKLRSKMYSSKIIFKILLNILWIIIFIAVFLILSIVLVNLFI